MSGATVRKAVFACPACSTRLIKRTSYLNHKYLRQDVFICDNPLCSAAYSGHTELTGLLSPSGVPDAPPCDLPPTPGYLRAMAAEAYRQATDGQQMDLLASMEGAADQAPQSC